MLCVSLLPWYDARPRVCQFLFDFWSKIISCSMQWKMKCFLFVVVAVFHLYLLWYSPQHKSFDHADNCYKSLIVFFLLLFSLIVTQKFDRLYIFRAMKNEHLHLPVQLGHNHFIKLLGLHHFCPKKWGMRVGGSKKTQIIWKKHTASQLPNMLC